MTISVIELNYRDNAVARQNHLCAKRKPGSATSLFDKNVFNNLRYMWAIKKYSICVEWKYHR